MVMLQNSSPVDEEIILTPDDQSNAENLELLEAPTQNNGSKSAEKEADFISHKSSKITSKNKQSSRPKTAVQFLAIKINHRRKKSLL